MIRIFGDRARAAGGIVIVSVLHQNKGGIGKSIPDVQEIPKDLRPFWRAKPRDISRVEGNLKGGGDLFANTS